MLSLFQMLLCKLCLAPYTVPVSPGGWRSFYHCTRCGLCFVPMDEWVSQDEERIRYAQHDNTRENTGYLHFLNQIVREVEAIHPRVKTILDFGCGEQAVLTQLLNEKGFACEGYDPLYRPMKQVGQYDLVILSEVIEHLREVREELARVHSLLAPEGKVLVRTRLYPATDALANWWYARDKTHINFFSTKALAEAARLAGRSTVECLAEDMFIWA